MKKREIGKRERERLRYREERDHLTHGERERAGKKEKRKEVRQT
jgi:hypothetical protein